MCETEGFRENYAPEQTTGDVQRHEKDNRNTACTADDALWMCIIFCFGIFAGEWTE